MKLSKLDEAKNQTFSSLQTIISNNIENNNDVFHPILKSTGFAFTIDNSTVILYKPNSDIILISDGDIYSQYEYFISNFINKNKLDHYTSYKIINDFMKHSKDEKKIFRLFNILSWPGSKKGLDIFNVFNSFSPYLTELLSSKKVGLNEAFYFHTTFKENYDELLEKLTEKTSYSENSTKLRLAFEIATEKEKNPSWIIDKLSTCKKPSEILDLLTQLKYEKLINTRKTFDDFIKKFKLPEYSKIIYDQNFEKETHSLNISFSDYNDLKKKTQNLFTSLNNNLIENDLFNVNNLFNKVMDNNDE